MKKHETLVFKVKWCDTCGGDYVECPRCGNNSCNGGAGENGNCPVCPYAYDFMNAVVKIHRHRPECRITEIKAVIKKVKK